MLVLAKVSACHLAPANASGEVTKRSEVGMTSSDKDETDTINRQLHVPHAECGTTAFGDTLYDVASCQHHVSIRASEFVYRVVLIFSCDPAAEHLIRLQFMA